MRELWEEVPFGTDRVQELRPHDLQTDLSSMANASECRTCSTDIPNLAYKCNYCGSTYCEEHRLPETHNCLGLKAVTESDQKWGLGILEDDKDIQWENNKTDTVKGSEIENQESDHTRSTDHSMQSSNPSVQDRVEQVIDILDLNEASSGDETNKPDSPYNTVDPTVYSSSPEPDYDSSPDVNPDGSVARPDRWSAHPDSNNSNQSNSDLYSGYKVAIIALVAAAILLALSLYLT